jgi:protease-4
MDSYDWFKGLVKTDRKMDDAALAKVDDGRIFTGRQAVDVKLVDEIGGEDVAVKWLGTRGVDTKLPVKDWQPARRGGGVFSFADAAVLWIAQKMGIAPDLLRGEVLDRILPQSLKLDGLLSVWQGSGVGPDGSVDGAQR